MGRCCRRCGTRAARCGAASSTRCKSSRRSGRRRRRRERRDERRTRPRATTTLEHSAISGDTDSSHLTRHNKQMPDRPPTPFCSCIIAPRRANDRTPVFADRRGTLCMLQVRYWCLKFDEKCFPGRDLKAQIAKAAPSECQEQGPGGAKEMQKIAK